MLIVNFLLLFVGIVILIFGANILVDSSSTLASRFNIPNIVIGLTIVSIGTSSPELVVNLLASANGNSDVALGNIVGSNIFNVLFILGICAIIFPLTMKSKTTTNEIPLVILASILLFVTANDVFLNKDGLNVISFSEGIVYLLFFIIFMAYIISLSKNDEDNEDEIEIKNWSKGLCVLLIVLGIISLAFGGNLILSNSTIIAQKIGIPERIIALTIISLGTSLPELATSITATLKRNLDIAVGNVVGSNIFNIFFILGLSSVINPVKIGDSTTNILGKTFSAANVDIVVNILAALFLFIFAFIGKKLHKLERIEGIFFVLFYISYIVYLILSI